MNLKVTNIQNIKDHFKEWHAHLEILSQRIISLSNSAKEIASISNMLSCVFTPLSKLLREAANYCSTFFHYNNQIEELYRSLKQFSCLALRLFTPPEPPEYLP
jgi:hypothetical protein